MPVGLPRRAPRRATALILGVMWSGMLLGIASIGDRVLAWRARELNIVMMAAALLVLVAWQAWNVGRDQWRRMSSRYRAPRPSIIVPAVLACILVAWAYLGARAVWLQGKALAETASRHYGASQQQKRAFTMGEWHALSRLADGVIPDAAVVGAAPGKPNMGTWRFISSLAPRRVISIPCAPGPVDMPYVAAASHCWGTSIPAAIQAGGAGVIGPLRQPRILRRLRAEVKPYEPGERAELVLRRPSGAVLVRQSISRDGWHEIRRPVDLPARERLLLTVQVGGGDGRAELGQVEAEAVPPGWVVAAWDASGNLVARRRSKAPQKPSPHLAEEEAPARPGELPRLLLGMGLLLAAGDGVRRLLARAELADASGLGAACLPSRAALAWIAGGGVATLGMHALVFAGASQWPGVLVLLALLAVLGTWLGRSAPPQKGPSFAFDERLLSGACLALVAFAMAVTWIRPMMEWDELINWGYRGHQVHHAGATDEVVRAYAAMSPRHKAYPLGIPLLEAYATLSMGRWDDARAKVAFPLFYGSIALLVFAAVAPLSRRAALAFAVLALLSPMAVKMAPVGMADLPLGCLFLAAVLCLDRWRVDRATVGWLLAAGLVGALMTWTKLDGGALKLLVIGLALAKGARRVRTHGLWLGAFLLLAFVPGVAWWIVYERVGLEDWVVNPSAFGLDSIGPKLALIPAILRALVSYLFVSDWGTGPLYAGTYVLLAAIAVASPAVLASRSCRLLTVALAAGIGGYCLIYVISPQGLYQMERSFDRILVHFYPLAVALGGRAWVLVRRRGWPGVTAMG